METTHDNNWWRKSIVYQIYPKSFKDTTGNGMGDLKGITEKLDYLKELGIDVIWLTPIYESPQRDNGYDISDYYNIQSKYGSMKDFDNLVFEAHRRDIKIIMDMVLNHTSTEHQWFKQSRASKDNPYRDYYLWRNAKEGKVPNNWISKFGGPAWQYDNQTNQYYLHLFDVSQADLNWENEEVRKQLYDVMHFWLNKGVDGFRLDVINLISKDPHYPDDHLGDGRTFYTDGYKVHDFIQEMNTEVFSKYNMMTVGEMSSTSIDHCIKYTKPDRKELDMVFNFHHLKVDYPNGEKWVDSKLDFKTLKKILSDWQVEMYKAGGWNALFWCNHDQPRIVSRFGDDRTYRKESAKMLATVIHMMQGTPYIYQGEEIGMTNAGFDHIEDYRDVETLNYYEIMKSRGMDHEAIMNIIKKRSRDNSRTPMQWNSDDNAGFTTGVPWINISSNYPTINGDEAIKDKDSIFYHYKKLIQLRKELDIITYGSYQLILKEDEDIFAYIRSYKNEKLLIINNFFDKEIQFNCPKELELSDYYSSILLSNYNDSSEDIELIQLRPYESIVYHLHE